MTRSKATTSAADSSEVERYDLYRNLVANISHIASVYCSVSKHASYYLQ
jgi:hypothetical protein